MNMRIDNPSLDRASLGSDMRTNLSVEDMVVLVGIQAMQFQQGKIQGQYQHISDQQALMKNLQKAITAAAHTKDGRLDKIVFDYTDPATGKTVKMDLKTFMERFGIDAPKPEYHGIVKFIKDMIDGIGKLLGKAVDFIKTQFPELVDTLDHIGQWVMDKIVKPATDILKNIDGVIGDFMKTGFGKALSAVALLAVGVVASIATFGALLPIFGAFGAFEYAVIAGAAFASVALLMATEKDFPDLYKLIKDVVEGVVDLGGVFAKLVDKLSTFLEKHLQEILENWTESLDENQWKEVGKNLKDTSESAGAMAQQDHLRLSNALNEYNELTQMVSNNLNKLTQMNLNVIGNMR